MRIALELKITVEKREAINLIRWIKLPLKSRLCFLEENSIPSFSFKINKKEKYFVKKIKSP